MSRTKFGHSFEVQGFLSSVSISIVAMPAAFVIVLITSISARSKGVEMASLLFSGPLIGQIVVQPLVAISMRAVSLHRQALIILWVRIVSAILCLYLVVNLTAPDLVLREETYFAYGVWTVLSIVDQPLAVRSNLLNCRYYNFSFLRSNSIGNLLGRGSMALAPLALLVTTQYVQYALWVLLMLIYLFSLYAPWHTLKKINPGQLFNNRADATKPKNRYFDRGVSWEKWFVLFQFLANASIGAIGFLLLSSAKYASLAPPPYSVLYGVFLVIQAILVFKIIRLENYATPRTVRNLFLLISITVMISGQTNHIFMIIIGTVVLGALYSFLLPLLAETVARKIADHRLPESLVIGKSVGRIASVVSIWLAGWALGSTVPISLIQLSFGVIGVISVVLLVIVERRIGIKEMILS